MTRHGCGIEVWFARCPLVAMAGVDARWGSVERIERIAAEIRSRYQLTEEIDDHMTT